MKRVVIDRFEGKYAVCEQEDKKMITLEKSSLPPEAKEGDVLTIEGETVRIDREETLKRQKEINKLMEDVWE